MGFLYSKNFLKAKILLSIFFIAVISINCEHCDDEDYTREAEEQNKLANTDSITIIKIAEKK